jgi:hypothetical protein
MLSSPLILSVMAGFVPAILSYFSCVLKDLDARHMTSEATPSFERLWPAWRWLWRWLA